MKIKSFDEFVNEAEDSYLVENVEFDMLEVADTVQYITFKEATGAIYEFNKQNKLGINITKLEGEFDDNIADFRIYFSDKYWISLNFTTKNAPPESAKYLCNKFDVFKAAMNRGDLTKQCKHLLFTSFKKSKMNIVQGALSVFIDNYKIIKTS